MTELTQEQIAKAARVVTGRQHYWIDVFGAGILEGAYDLPQNELLTLPLPIANSRIWSPSFIGEDGRRSQALALAEWLAAKLAAPGNDWGLLYKMLDYIKNKDTTALMAMVIELGEL